LPRIDLLLAGSPCTDISMAGRQGGIAVESLSEYLELKAAGTEFNGQSYLFWEFIRIRRDLLIRNPKMTWLLENVDMKKKFFELFNKTVGGHHIKINSALVSAQNRVRNYWTGFGGIEQPKDRGIFLKDVIESDAEFCIAYNRKDKLKGLLTKSYAICESDWRGLNRNQNQTAVVTGCAQRGRYTGCRSVGRKIGEDGKRHDYAKELKTEQQIELRVDGKAGCLTTVQKDSMLAMIGYVKNDGQGNRIYSTEGKAPSLCAESGGLAGNANCLVTESEEPEFEVSIRRLLPVECERLQTVPDEYTKYQRVLKERKKKGVVYKAEWVTQETPKTHRFKALGNGWTVEVITHILSSWKGLNNG
jgi:site-specific DNA-cytosine methylase